MQCAAAAADQANASLFLYNVIVKLIYADIVVYNSSNSQLSCILLSHLLLVIADVLFSQNSSHSVILNAQLVQVFSMANISWALMILSNRLFDNSHCLIVARMNKHQFATDFGLLLAISWLLLKIRAEIVQCELGITVIRTKMFWETLLHSKPFLMTVIYYYLWSLTSSFWMKSLAMLVVWLKK